MAACLSVRGTAGDWGQTCSCLPQMEMGRGERDDAVAAPICFDLSLTPSGAYLYCEDKICAVTFVVMAPCVCLTHMHSQLSPLLINELILVFTCT